MYLYFGTSSAHKTSTIKQQPDPAQLRIPDFTSVPKYPLSQPEFIKEALGFQTLSPYVFQPHVPFKPQTATDEPLRNQGWEYIGALYHHRGHNQFKEGVMTLSKQFQPEKFDLSQALVITPQSNTRNQSTTFYLYAKPQKG
jgi:hypothetical protein